MAPNTKAISVVVFVLAFVLVAVWIVTYTKAIAFAVFKLSLAVGICYNPNVNKYDGQSKTTTKMAKV